MVHLLHAGNSLMKTLKSWTVPLAALVLVGVLIGFKETEISQTVEETEVLERTLRAAGNVKETLRDGTDFGQRDARAFSGNNSEGRSALQSCRLALRRAFVDGVIIGEESHRVRQLAYKLSPEEGRILLEEIDLMSEGYLNRYWLGDMLVPALTENCPEVLVEHHYVPGMDSKNLQTATVASAYEAWAEKDLQAALAWYGKRVLAGDLGRRSLDGKSEFLDIIEQALIRSATAYGNQEALSRVLENMDDPQRKAKALEQFKNRNPAE